MWHGRWAGSRVGPSASAAGAPAPTDPNAWVEPLVHVSPCHAASKRSSCLLPGYLGRQQCSAVSWTVVLVDGQTRAGGWLFLRAVRRPPVREGSEAVAVGGMRNTASNEFGLFCFTRLWGDMR